MRAMTRLKLPTFSLEDCDFFREYTAAMAPIATALDRLQAEGQAYLGCVLPILAVTTMRLKDMKERRLLDFCSSLVEALLAGTEKRFGHLREDTEYQLAAGFHPRFRLGWLEKTSPDLVDRVRLAMESVLEDALREESSGTATGDTGVDEGEEEVDRDYFAAIISPSIGPSASSRYST
jgi:hypothetical protein